MTLREIFKESPIEEGESNKSYAIRLAGKYDKNWRIVEREFYRQRKDLSFVTTTKTLNAAGKVISEKQALRGVPEQIPKGHIVVATTTNQATGQQWLKTSRLGQYDIPTDEIEQAINESVKSLDLKPIEIDVKESPYTSILVYTDVHVGMFIEENATFGGVWDKDSLEQRRVVMVEKVVKTCAPGKILIFDFGDFVDGYEGYTTRGSHLLPQNMSTEEAFEVGSNFKINLVRDLANLGYQVECHDVTNDNHSGAFGYMVSYHAGKMAEGLFKAKFFTYKKFINHLIIGRHCFIFTHGKDRKSRKFGFPTVQDKKAIDQISDYVDYHNLGGMFIHFMKGDSHQALFDLTNQKWDYMNYPAFSPASAWVQANFTKGRSGFVIHKFYDGERALECLPHFF